MNFILSFLIYNPLEAMIIILLMLLVSKNNMKIDAIILNSYILGTLNLVFQSMTELSYGTIIYPIIDVIVQFVILPVILCEYCNRIMNIRLRFYKIYILRILCSFTTLIILLLFNRFSIVNIFANCIYVHQELFANLSIRIIQFAILRTVKIMKGDAEYERTTKENC
jgi:hypothetical protein